jgi:uncharacterized damage-inducible protein DinB
MKQFFGELFEYNHHFNQKLGDVFYSNSAMVSQKAVKLYNHILNAHQIWNNRIERKQITVNVWEIHPVQVLKEMDRVNYEQTLILLDKYDLNERISYTTFKEQVFHNSIRDILFHIINHSTYHRGQIASDFRENEIEPLATDYIFYKR